MKTNDSIMREEYGNRGMVGYRWKARKKIFILMGVLLLCLTSFLTDICLGSGILDFSDVLKALLGKSTINENAGVIVWSVRFPAALMAISVGGALGLAGAVMQTILDNPLASPYTLGVSASAGFGASLALVTGSALIPFVGIYSVPVYAFIFSAIASGMIYFIGRTQKMSSEIMILAGIGLLFLFQALQSFMQYVASPEVLQSIVFWLFGSLTKANLKNTLLVLMLFVICVPFIIKDSWKLTALRLGDEKAKNLGVDVERLRIKTFIIISLLTSISVCFVGTIGFIGLVGPHMSRMLVGEDQRFFLPLSALCGMLILSVASIGSKIVVPGMIFPIGIITAMIGVPFFFSLILSRKRRSV